MGLENPLHIAILLIIVLVVFGAKRLPEMGRSLGEGMRNFKSSISGEGTSTAQTLPPVQQAPPTAPATPPAPVQQAPPAAPATPPAPVPAASADAAHPVPAPSADAAHPVPAPAEAPPAPEQQPASK